MNQEDPFLDAEAFSVGRSARRPTFAEFESECLNCGWDIEIGEEIKPDGIGGWMHEGCAE